VKEAFDLDRFQAGDEVLFAELVHFYSPPLLPHLRRYAHLDADLHDLLQDVWLRAYRKRQTFEGRGSFFGWLLMVSRTVGLPAVSKRKRGPLTEELCEIAAETDLDADLLSDTVRNAVLALPERQRDIVLLRLVEGMSTAETAQRLRCAEGR
jgi:RNA polymerase sigma-70 factor (ECF subfamily)